MQNMRDVRFFREYIFKYYSMHACKSIHHELQMRSLHSFFSFFLKLRSHCSKCVCYTWRLHTLTVPLNWMKDQGILIKQNYTFWRCIFFMNLEIMHWSEHDVISKYKKGFFLCKLQTKNTKIWFYAEVKVLLSLSKVNYFMF